MYGVSPAGGVRMKVQGLWSRTTLALLGAALIALALQLAVGARPVYPAPFTGGGFTTNAVVTPLSGPPGSAPSATISVTSTDAMNVLVDVEVFSAAGARIHQNTFDNQAFAAGQTREFRVTWNVPAVTPAGTQIVKVGIFTAGWGTLFHWNDYAGTYAVFNLATPTGDVIKIMPLGDSLTDGFNIPGGYRTELWARLRADGRNIDFVGSLQNGPASLPDKHHEGHSGWRIDQIAAAVQNWLTVYQPHIVLLLIGTNDVAQDYELATAPDRLSGLIDQITATLPETHLIVGSIPRMGAPQDLAQVQAYNAAIPGLVDGKRAAGKRVSFVDIFSVIAVADLHTDFTHMATSGNTNLASAWYAALQPVLSPAPPPPAATPTATPPPRLPGDASGNGSVAMEDALVTAQCVVRAIDCRRIDEKAADVNCSGTLTIGDALIIASRVLLLSTTFPC
jgi:hypothetical protein